MAVSRKMILRLGILMLLTTGSCITIWAQEKASRDTFDIAGPSIHYPNNYKTTRFLSSVGLSMVTPPKDMLETAVEAPLANFHIIYGLPRHFSLEGDITTIIVSNQLRLGPRVSFSQGNFGLKAGWDLAYATGFLKHFGFNNSTRAWIHYPNFSAGYKMQHIAFTLEAETILVSSVTTKSGDSKLTRSKIFLNGYTGAFYIEQRLHRNRVFAFGFKDNYVKYYWPTWMVFSTFNRFYHIPELCFSWIL